MYAIKYRMINYRTDRVVTKVREFKTLEGLNRFCDRICEHDLFVEFVATSYPSNR